MATLLAMITLMLIGLATSPVHAEKIKKAREEIRGQDSKPPREHPPESYYQHGRQRCDDPLGYDCSAPHCSCDVPGHCGDPVTGGCPPQTAPMPFLHYFAAYPYHDDLKGYVHVIRPPSDEPEDKTESENPGVLLEPPEGSSSYSLRLTAEYGYDFDKVHRPSAELFFTTTSIVGFSLKYVYLAETVSGTVDHAGVGEANFIVQFLQTPWVLMHGGLGLRMFFDQGSADTGLNATLGMDIFPIRPLVASASISLGRLVEASVTAARGQIGWMLGRAELFLGYDVLAIERVVFHGPLAGVRTWL